MNTAKATLTLTAIMTAITILVVLAIGVPASAWPVLLGLLSGFALLVASWTIGVAIGKVAVWLIEADEVE